MYILIYFMYFYFTPVLRTTIKIYCSQIKKPCEIAIQKLFYSRHKYLEFQKYVVWYSFERAFGTYRDEGTTKCSPPFFRLNPFTQNTLLLLRPHQIFRHSGGPVWECTIYETDCFPIFYEGILSWSFAKKFLRVTWSYFSPF